MSVPIVQTLRLFYKVDPPTFGGKYQTTGSVNNQPTHVRRRNARFVKACRRTRGKQFIAVYKTVGLSLVSTRKLDHLDSCHREEIQTMFRIKLAYAELPDEKIIR